MTLHYFVCSSQKDVDMLMECRAKNVLVSYAYISQNKFKMDLEELNQHFDSVFVDSGAFTSARLGVTIDIDDYMGFLFDNEGYYDTAAHLDVLQDVEGTIDQYRYMIDNGCEMVSPVLQGMYTYCLSEMEKIGIFTDWVHLGNSGWYDSRGIDVIPKIRGMTTKYKYHGLAKAGEENWKKGIFYSTDSSSWLATAQYGQSDSYIKGIRQNIMVGHKNRREDILSTERALYMCKDDLEACNIDPRQVRAVHRDTLSRLNIALFYRPLMRKIGIFDKNFYS